MVAATGEVQAPVGWGYSPIEVRKIPEMAMVMGKMIRDVEIHSDHLWSPKRRSGFSAAKDFTGAGVCTLLGPTY